MQLNDLERAGISIRSRVELLRVRSLAHQARNRGPARATRSQQSARPRPRSSRAHSGCRADTRCQARRRPDNHPEMPTPGRRRALPTSRRSGDPVVRPTPAWSTRGRDLRGCSARGTHRERRCESPTGTDRDCSRAVRIPSVASSTRVSDPNCRSKRTCHPTSLPTVQPCSLAIRRAMLRAATLRGCSTMTGPSTASAGGTLVVLPAPGAAVTTTARDSRTRARISAKNGSMGSGWPGGTDRFYRPPMVR